jgi:H+-transporting ATPase
MSLRKTSEYRQLSVEETIELLESSTKGLAESDALEQIGRFGRNEVAERERNPVLDFLSRYWGPMPWLLEVAMLLSYVLVHYLELVIIFGLLITNAIIGFLPNEHVKHFQICIRRLLTFFHACIRTPLRLPPLLWSSRGEKQK